MISYQTDGVEMPAIKKSQTTEWIKAVAATYKKRVGEIAYIFCSDEKILEVNRQYLQHDYYTDIITFDYCEGNRLSGDLFISLDTVRTNAEQFGSDYETELHRCVCPPYCTPHGFSVLTIDTETGKLCWEKQLPVNGLPALIDGLVAGEGVVYAGTGKGLCAFEARTGKQTFGKNEGLGFLVVKHFTNRCLSDKI